MYFSKDRILLVLVSIYLNIEWLLHIIYWSNFFTRMNEYECDMWMNSQAESSPMTSSKVLRIPSCTRHPHKTAMELLARIF